MQSVCCVAQWHLHSFPARLYEINDSITPLHQFPDELTLNLLQQGA